MALKGPYNPSPKQIEFHKDKHFVKVLLCGVGFGKTTAAVFEILKKVFSECPGKNGMVIAPTIEMLRQGILRVWQEIVPQEWYSFNANTKEMIIKATGSKIYWKSSYDPKRLQGVEISWVAFDEAAVETDPEVYAELVNRLRDVDPKIKPQIFITTTPALGWLQDAFGTGPENGFEGTEDCWYNNNSIVFRATTYDNPALAKTNYIQNILNQPQASPEWIQQNIFAKYVSRTGTVFKEFNFQKHLISNNPEDIIKYYGAFDFGFTAPSCLSIFGMTAKKEIILIKEFYKNNLTWDENGWFKIFKEVKEFYKIDTIIVDHAHNERIAASNKFFNHRPKFVPCVKETDESINRIKKMFVDNRFLIHKNCQNTIKELQRWSWATDKFGKATDKPEAGNDHAIDTIRYFFMFLPSHFFSSKLLTAHA